VVLNPRFPQNRVVEPSFPPSFPPNDLGAPPAGGAPPEKLTFNSLPSKEDPLAAKAF
jgi:hypothetical protein